MAVGLRAVIDSLVEDGDRVIRLAVVVVQLDGFLEILEGHFVLAGLHVVDTLVDVNGRSLLVGQWALSAGPFFLLRQGGTGCIQNSEQHRGQAD